jgi:hypothetical protein
MQAYYMPPKKTQIDTIFIQCDCKIRARYWSLVETLAGMANPNLLNVVNQNTNSYEFRPASLQSQIYHACQVFDEAPKSARVGARGLRPKRQFGASSNPHHTWLNFMLNLMCNRLSLPCDSRHAQVWICDACQGFDEAPKISRESEPDGSGSRRFRSCVESVTGIANFDFQCHWLKSL